MSQLSISHQDLAVLLNLALLIEDVDRDELRSLREAARRLDQHRNWLVTGGQNDRVARPVSTVPCTFTDHHLSGRAAARAGVAACRCAGDRVVPAFTEKARGELLTDPSGWSRASYAVDDVHGPAATSPRTNADGPAQSASGSNPAPLEVVR